MNVADVKNQIKKKEYNSFYIFSGDNWKVQQIYIQQIVKVSNLEYKYVYSISDVWKDITDKSFLNNSYCYVVRDDTDILQNEKLQEQLNKDVLQDNIIILLLTNTDKRTKFYKKYKDIIVDFEQLKPELLKKYIQKEIPLSDRNCNILMEVCENDYGRCLLEIDKIKRYNPEQDVNNVFIQLLDDGIIYVPPQDAIFDFVDSILNADVNNVFYLYYESLASGEAIMVMLSVLYNNAKAVLQVQSCESRNVEKVTGLTSWQIKNARKHLNVFSNIELVNIMQMCQYCESGIKKGIISEDNAMMYVLSNIDW